MNIARERGNQEITDLLLIKGAKDKSKVFPLQNCIFGVQRKLVPYVAPDGSYLLYSSFKPGGYGEDDIYITYRKVNGTWTTPANLGDKINSKYSDNRVYVSPDGKYLFYTNTRRGNLDIYWVDTKMKWAK
jgi:hypothetical protein